MKVVSSDSADKNNELCLNYSSSKSDEFSKKEKIKDIYFIVLYEKRTIEKPNDFIFTKNEYQAENICTKMINKKPDLFIYQKVFKLNINGEKNENKKEINLEF